MLDHLQAAITGGEPHGLLALKVQNIRAELERHKRADKALADLAEFDGKHLLGHKGPPCSHPAAQSGEDRK